MMVILHYIGGPLDGLTVEYVPLYLPPRHGSYLTRKERGGYYTSATRWEPVESDLYLYWTYSPPVQIAASC